MTEDVRRAPAMEESDADSDAYTKERREAGQKHLEESQEMARQQFVFLGEPEPEIEIPDPADRPLDTETMTDREVEALRTQDSIASEGYKPRGFDDFRGETFESPDINPEAKEFQLNEDFTPSDEFTGPEAHDKAAATGVNPRSAATSTDPEGLVGSEEAVEELTGEDADTIQKEQGGHPEGEQVEPTDGERVSKSSPEDAPNRIEK